MTPTSRTLDKLRQQGYDAAIVEKWNPYARIRQDLFGCIDIVAVKCGAPLIGIQCTTRDNISHRRNKIKENPHMKAWLGSGCQLQVWGWYKEKNRWQVKVEDIRTNPELLA
jgi:hypothetical protein